MLQERMARSTRTVSQPPLAGLAVSLFLLSLVLPPSMEAQARGSLVGIVKDEVSSAPVEDAVVTLVEPGRKVETDANGGFIFLDLPLGTATMRVTKGGYGTVVEQVQVESRDFRTFEVFLPRMESMLDELLVPAEETSRSLGHVEYEVESGERYRTALEVLQGRVPGLFIGSSSGDLGKGAQIRIRGVGTIQGTNWPSVYLDGVRIDSRGPPASVTGNGYALGVLQTIPADQVERVRVLSGPAATSKYQDGANGVIVIETVRGGRDQDDEEGEG